MSIICLLHAMLWTLWREALLGNLRNNLVAQKSAQDARDIYLACISIFWVVWLNVDSMFTVCFPLSAYLASFHDAGVSKPWRESCEKAGTISMTDVFRQLEQH